MRRERCSEIQTKAMGDTEVGLALPIVRDDATLDGCRQVARRAVDAGSLGTSKSLPMRELTGSW